MTVDSWMITLD